MDEATLRRALVQAKALRHPKTGCWDAAALLEQLVAEVEALRVQLASVEAERDRLKRICNEALPVAQQLQQAIADLEAERDAARQAADVQFHAYCDAELQAVCAPCFQAVCEPCIAQRGTAGDGQPCRCSHAGHYAMGLESVTRQLGEALAERDAARAELAKLQKADIKVWCDRCRRWFRLVDVDQHTGVACPRP